MITFALVALLALAAACFAALQRALKGAIDGYEDENGFHAGAAPRPVHTAEIHEIHVTTGRAA